MVDEEENITARGKGRMRRSAMNEVVVPVYKPGTESSKRSYIHNIYVIIINITHFPI